MSDKNSPKPPNDKIVPLSSLTMPDPSAKNVNRNPVTPVTPPKFNNPPPSAPKNNVGPPAIQLNDPQRTVIPNRQQLPKVNTPTPPAQNIRRPEEKRDPSLDRSVASLDSLTFPGAPSQPKNNLKQNVDISSNISSTTQNIGSKQDETVVSFDGLTFPESVVKASGKTPVVRKLPATSTNQYEQPTETASFPYTTPTPSFNISPSYYADNSTVITTTDRVFSYNDQTVIVETTDAVYVNTIEETINQNYITNVDSGVGGSGYSGYSGWSGESGYSGGKGDQGFSGYSGVEGPQGISGYSGKDGSAAFSGYSGVSGYSGEGISGYSGEIGSSGYSGESGFSGFSGEIGSSGYSGENGQSGISGYSGVDGVSGYSGADGASGISGYSGVDGVSGYSGETGISGYSGEIGFSGYSGASFSGDYISTITGGTGVTVTDGTGSGANATVAIGQAVATTDTVTFQNIVVGPGGTLTFYDDLAKAAAAGATIPYAQITAAGKFYTNADALAGYTITDMKPGDFYYDDVSASIYICIDTGLGYYDLLDLTVRA